MNFEQRAVVITGATSGIGQAAARRFIEEGATLLAVGRDRAALDVLASTSERVKVCEADLTHDDAPARVVELAVEALGGIDVLVNAAGVIETGPLESTTDEAWDRMLSVNLRAPFRLLRAALPHLEARQGAVVNVSSVAGPRVFPGLLTYCVSKAGLDQLTRCAAIELASRGVRVNAVNPGVVVTNLHKRSGMSEEQYAAFLEHSKQTHPMGRAGQPEEVAELILFLASTQAGWITGETMAIDGGRHLTCAR
jgi:NAD(P)-dependent dehydrogenase (short-subunit alcohol dehydrogenase family)